MISTIGKKVVDLQGLPYMPPTLVNFGPETAENDCQIWILEKVKRQEGKHTITCTVQVQVQRQIN